MPASHTYATHLAQQLPAHILTSLRLLGGQHTRKCGPRNLYFTTIGLGKLRGARCLAIILAVWPTYASKSYICNTAGSAAPSRYLD